MGINILTLRRVNDAGGHKDGYCLSKDLLLRFRSYQNNRNLVDSISDLLNINGICQFGEILLSHREYDDKWLVQNLYISKLKYENGVGWDRGSMQWIDGFYAKAFDEICGTLYAHANNRVFDFADNSVDLNVLYGQIVSLARKKLALAKEEAVERGLRPEPLLIISPAIAA